MKKTLYTLVTNSTALEGSTLKLEQNVRLLEDGISSEGKTIAEQLLNLDLYAAYEAAFKDASEHQSWSGYRVKTLCSKALRSYGFDCSRVRDESVLQRICQEANEARMHAKTLGPEGLYAASFLVHFRFSDAVLWPKGNDIAGRLLMNMMQVEFGLEPLSVADSEGYKRILSAAVHEDISDIFTRHAGEVLLPAGRCPVASGGTDPSALLRNHIRENAAGAVPPEAKVKNSTRILELLTVHPRYTTAELAAILHISAKGVEKHLANLKRSGVLLRVGPDKGGHWQVLRIV